MADINNHPSGRLSNPACWQSGGMMATTLVAALTIAEHWLRMLMLRSLETRHQSGHAHARRRPCSVLFRLYSEIFGEAPCLPDPRSRISLALVAGILNRHSIISQNQTSN